MYDYEKFKAAAYRYKYDIAAEFEKSRLTYNELYEKVNALYNALANMGVSGSAVLLCPEPFELMVSAFALSKCSLERIICNYKISEYELKKICKKYSPSVVFLKNTELERLAPVLSEAGVNTAVTYGASGQLLPAVFEYEKLVDTNDYLLVKEYTASAKTEFLTAAKCDMLKLSDEQIKGGVFVDIPSASEPFASAVCDILYRGGRLFFTQNLTKKMVSKKKISCVLTDSRSAEKYASLGADVQTFEPPLRIVAGVFFDGKYLSENLTEMTGTNTEAVFNGAIINVTAHFEKDFDAGNGKARMQAVTDAAKDLLCAYNVKKTIAFKKSRV